MLSGPNGLDQSGTFGVINSARDSPNIQLPQADTGIPPGGDAGPPTANA